MSKCRMTSSPVAFAAHRSSWVAVGLLVALTALTGCDRFLGVEGRIDRARSELETGDYSAAMRDLKSALESEPDNAQARALLARLSLRVGDADAARKELDRALGAGADRASLRDLHYAILLAQGRYEDALADANADEGFDELRRLIVLASAQTALGRHEEARHSIERAVALAPEDPEARLIEARWLWATGKLDESTAALDRLLEKHPDFARAAIYRGRLALALGDAEGAGKAFARAREHAAKQLNLPERIEALVGLIESKFLLGDAAAAEPILKELESRAPKAFLTHYLKARLAYSRRSVDTAVKHLQHALVVQPESVPARMLLGAALLEQGALEQARAELARLVEEHPENIEARKLLARAYVLQNDPAGARRVLDEVPVGVARDAGVDWMSGSVRLMTGQTEEGIALLEQGAAADPDNVPLRLDLARAYLLDGRRESALALLRSLPEGAGGLRRRQLTVLAEIAGRTPEEAKQAIARLVEEHPEDAGLLVVSGLFLVGSGDAEDAAKLFDKAVAADARNVDARFGLAIVALQAGDMNLAAERLQKVVELDATNERAYVALAGIALTRGERDSARQWLEKAIGTNPAAVESRLRLAELAYADKDAARGGAMIEQALAVTKNRPATLNSAGQILRGASKFEDALKRFNEAAALGSGEAEVNAAVMMIGLGRLEEARGRLEAAMRAQPKWPAPLTVLVRLDAGQRRFDQALERVAAFEKSGGAAAIADELRGDVSFAAGHYEQAAEAYARAQRARPSGPLAVRVFRAGKAAGKGAPESSLVDWLQKHPRDPMVRVILGEHYQQEGHRKAAIAQYELAAQLAPGPAVLNNLAWLYYETGDERAVDLAQRAHTAAPGSIEIADTYGWILLEQGKTAEGLKTLETAAKGAPNHPDIQYHYAAALARSGNRQEAADALRKLLAAHEAFASRRDAETLLKSLS